MALHRLTKIVVGVPDVAAAIPYYSDFGLEHLGEGRFSTTDGGEQLLVSERSRRGLIEIGIGADDQDDLDRIAFELGRSQVQYKRDGDVIVALDEGSGVQARVTVAERYDQAPVEVPTHNMAGHEARRNERAPGSMRSGQVRPRKLGHVVVGSTNVAASEHLFIDLLGFEVSDSIRDVGKFVRC